MESTPKTATEQAPTKSGSARGASSIWAPHLSARFLLPFLAELEPIWGAERLEEYLQKSSVTAAELRRETGCVSFDFGEAIIADLARIEGLDFIARCGGAFVSRRYAGLAFWPFRVLGSPGALYRSLPLTGQRLNKVSDVRVTDRGPNRVTVSYGTLSPHREIQSTTCFLRRQHLMAAPRLWGLPPAVLRESECMHHGAERCTYEITYASVARPIAPFLGLASGALVGTIPRGTLEDFAFIATTALLGAAVGLALEINKARRESQVFFAQQQHDVENLLRDSEHRFTELTVEMQRREIAEEGIRQAELQMRHNDRLAAVGATSAKIAHEIRNPLSAVATNLHFLQDHSATWPEESRAALRDSLVCVDGIAQIVDQVKVGMDPRPGPLGPVDLAHVTKRALAMVDSKLRGRAELSTHFDEHPPVVGNEGQLCQVLVNLLSNAFQAVEPGCSPPGRVTIRVFPERARVICAVQDTGHGIDPAHRARLFEPFFTTKSAGEGTGLGLAIAQAIARMHGGAIDVESTPGTGSTFRLALPVLAGTQDTA